MGGVNRQVICLELNKFAFQLKHFLSKLTVGLVHDNNDTDDENEEKIPKEHNPDKCRNCFYCAFVIIWELYFQLNIFSNLFLVYKFDLILPSTQVTCERVFSKLKIVKTKLQSTISQENLGLLMAVEKDILIDKEKIIDDLAKSSNILKGLLLQIEISSWVYT